MAEDLDDGELWLPSDIIPDLGVYPHHHRPSSGGLRLGYPSDLAYVEDMAQKLAALGFLDRNQPLTALNHSQEFRPSRPATRFDLVDRETGTGFFYGGFDTPLGRSISGFGNVGRRVGSTSVCQLIPVKPTQTQVEGFGQGRARVLQRPHSHGQNRVFPVRTSGSGRECGGTGVFLPRVINNDVRRKPSKPNMRNGDQQKQPTRNAVVGKQGMPLQPSSVMGLPHDWTY